MLDLLTTCDNGRGNSGYLSSDGHPVPELKYSRKIYNVSYGELKLEMVKGKDLNYIFISGPT